MEGVEGGGGGACIASGVNGPTPGGALNWDGAGKINPLPLVSYQRTID